MAFPGHRWSAAVEKGIPSQNPQRRSFFSAAMGKHQLSRKEKKIEVYRAATLGPGS